MDSSDHSEQPPSGVASETALEEVALATEPTTTTEEQSQEAPTEQSTADNMDKLRQAALKRKMRRNASRRIASDSDATTAATTEQPNTGDTTDADPEVVAKLREELTTARLEMASMRRNHVTNVQKLTRERDMFAIQLSKEQEEVTPESKRGMEELRSDLKAAKLRVSNMEEENARMREELKELRLRVTAFKTLDAANSGYESVVDDLIHVKLKLATLSADKENLEHENRVLKADNDTLTTANGLLEKSRTDWVHKCAALEKLLQAGSSDGIGMPTAPGRAETRAEKSMSMSSDLQELAL